ncbi:ATP-binding protein [Corallococcus sp. BB11-1]|uniref:ATP-binding protein n=1 Tax=Corallococcus sp. BB11-1 TaxID=2996783 RepID=UPI00226E1B7F|nr:ATP-binding protein [Corallococcus sp. BB11-1]MCY1031658.1 ATP-binding protein [Corallococcus sp. BB11-1]
MSDYGRGPGGPGPIPPLNGNAHPGPVRNGQAMHPMNGHPQPPPAGPGPRATTGPSGNRIPSQPPVPPGLPTTVRQVRGPQTPPGSPSPRGPPPPSGGPPSGGKSIVQETPPEVLHALASAQVDAQEAAKVDPELAFAVGFTHFDTSASHDNLITVLSTKEDLPRLASQTLVRVKSREDKRSYLGVVVSGPFAEPNAVPANSSMAIGVVTHGKKLTYTFDYHGRAEVELLGEEVGGILHPPRFRPRPQSPVFILDEEESARVLGMGLAGEAGAELSLGMVVGYEGMEARLNPRDKSILPRHTGIIGTTGGGKSTTVATLIYQAQLAGIATIVFDVEGEYTHINKPTDQPAMQEALKRRRKRPDGVKDLHIHHLLGRATRNREHRPLHRFSLNFSSLSPYALAEILDMTDAQQERFLKAYDVTKLLLEDFGIFPTNEQERRHMLEVDELSTGYPRMTIQHVLDVVNAYLYSLSDDGKTEARAARPKPAARKRAPVQDDLKLGEEPAEDEPTPLTSSLQLFSEFKTSPGRVMARVMAASSRNEISWKALASKLHRLRRLNIFDMGSSEGVKYDAMLTPGRVSVIDLSDTDSPQINNLVIADILRGLQERQELSYEKANRQGGEVTPVLIIIEEAHEFLSANRITQMPVLFEQVARIAKRGRKRWLGLVFVTQLPQHLPNEVLGLLNNFIIHKITDGAVISRMQKTVGSIDESLWNRVSRLAPGQALVSFSNFTRPLMVAVDPAPVKRLLVE